MGAGMNDPADLTRTALVMPPRGRAVLCVWAALPGAAGAPFAFWRSLTAGAVFCALWAVLIAGVWVRACSFAAALSEQTLTVYAGVVFPVRRAMPRRAVTGVRCLHTPLLRLARVRLLLIEAPGARLLLPAVPEAQALRLAELLTGEVPE